MDFDFEIDGLAVRFFNRTVFTANTWAWDFGDAGTSTLREPRHTYDLPGTYAVTLTATCGSRSSTVTKILKLNVGPGPQGIYQLDTTGLDTISEIPGAGSNQHFEPSGAFPLSYLNVWVLNDSSLPLLVQSYSVSIDFMIGDLLDFTTLMLASPVASLTGTSRTVFFSVTLSNSGGGYELPLLGIGAFSSGSGNPVTVTNPSGIYLVTTSPPSDVEVTDCPALEIPDYKDAQVVFTLANGLPPLT